MNWDRTHPQAQIQQSLARTEEASSGRGASRHGRSVYLQDSRSKAAESLDKMGQHAGMEDHLDRHLTDTSPVHKILDSGLLRCPAKSSTLVARVCYHNPLFVIEQGL